MESLSLPLTKMSKKGIRGRREFRVKQMLDDNEPTRDKGQRTEPTICAGTEIASLPLHPKISLQKRLQKLPRRVHYLKGQHVLPQCMSLNGAVDNISFLQLLRVNTNWSEIVGLNYHVRCNDTERRKCLFNK